MGGLHQIAGERKKSIREDVSVVRHKDRELIAQAQQIVADSFSDEASLYGAMSLGEYRDLIAATQDKINAAGYVRKIAHDLIDKLVEITCSDDLLVQANCYLRAARPNSSATQETVDWHRESFYGPSMERALNVWTPIANVTPQNTLHYVPASAAIPDSEILIEQLDDTQTPRFSSGHKIGLLYSPKKIVGGIDFSNSQPMIVDERSSAIFSAQLIHGAAVNNAKTIRFSLDFRLTPKSAYRETKKHFAAGYQDFFVEL
jgi:ectoine hydroxylase-related dioxygenase (phytanoyl-CoA dioxygenase family)